MNARRRKTIKKTSLRQERQTAQDIDGRTQANSGATRMGGGADVRAHGDTRVECKFTEKDRYTLKLDELVKLRKQAIKSLEYPVFQFAFLFNNQLTKYAVISWKGDVSAADTSWGTIAKQMTLLRDNLQLYLLSGRIHLSFSPRGATLSTLHQRSFEVMRWEDYLKMREQAE